MPVSSLALARRLVLSLGASALLLSACATSPPPSAVQVNGLPIAYRLQGQGSGPTVVLQAGLGDGQAVWSELLPHLSARHRVFSFDRPGYGDSPRASGARDPCTQARELRSVLRAAGVAPPYVLVGHSIGGLYQHAFARLYPDELAGLLLIEPTHPQHWSSMQREAPAIAALVRTLRASAFTSTMRDEFDAQTECLDRLPPLDRRPPPALLLRREAFPLIEQGAFADMVERLWDDWRRLAAVEPLVRLPGTDHYLQRRHPAAVAAAVDDLVTRACRSAHATPGDPGCAR